MSVAIKKRLDQLEATHRQDNDQLSTWRVIVCNKTGLAPDWRVPVIGWRHSGTDIMRLDGETDDELQDRALLFAEDQQTEPPARVLEFLQIIDSNEEEELRDAKNA